MHAFADESARQRYLVAAVLLDPTEVDPARRALRGLCMAGQRRVHFAKESDSRRRTVVSTLLRLGLRTRVYECAGRDVPARATCLAHLVDDLVDLGAVSLVLETLDPQVRADRTTIRSRLEVSGGSLTYGHRRAHEEPLLWAADAMAWCYGAGGEWRRRIAPSLDKAVRLDL